MVSNIRRKNRLNYYAPGDFTKFGYDKSGILKFGPIKHPKTYFKDHILENRREKQFTKQYAFNNFRLSVFETTAYPGGSDETETSAKPNSSDVQSHIKNLKKRETLILNTINRSLPLTFKNQTLLVVGKF